MLNDLGLQNVTDNVTYETMSTMSYDLTYKRKPVLSRDFSPYVRSPGLQTTQIGEASPKKREQTSARPNISAARAHLS